MSETLHTVVTSEEVKQHLGIDYADNAVDANIARLIKTADAYLRGAIGEDYPKDDPRAKELALQVISELYDTRGMTSTVYGNARKLIDDLAFQLRLELRRESDE